ncbi:hypothetical protein [Bradyrhizobium cajani]|uniref:Uncharacterized protein n=1 Tax=Bradyrhizobium cajani TaxID=1928661 RepID=A0A844T7R1_9BRAD|nr:hypothetical protein [Bradyrhizobium cajani]MCP3371170.1 hypothetical protein [Bradyrhizobium cajani]MVT72449.1 hypothetical protein [Bradyrhizobium cajani]
MPGLDPGIHPNKNGGPQSPPFFSIAHSVANVAIAIVSLRYAAKRTWSAIAPAWSRLALIGIIAGLGATSQMKLVFPYAFE